MGDAAGLIEMLLVFGGVLAFAIWEVVKLRREKRAKDDRDAAG
jgi:cbb3-type cytochrome oxidase subunit 3